MEYRKLPHGNEKISVLGMGTSVVGEASEKMLWKPSPMHLTTESIILTLQNLEMFLQKSITLPWKKMLPSVFSAATATKDVRSLLTR